MKPGILQRLSMYLRLLRELDRRQLYNTIVSRFRAPGEVVHHRPKQLSVYITSRCNLACKMCGYHSPKSSGEYLVDAYPDMTVERFAHALGFFPEAHSITLTAEGEPFLNSDIYDMVRHAKSHGKRTVSSSTNGVLMDVERILACGLDSLNISVDGTCPEHYVAIRGGCDKTFRRVVENATRLIERRDEIGSPLTVSFSFIISTANFQQMPEMMSYAEEFGADVVHFQNAMDFGTLFSKESRPLFDTDLEAVDFLGALVKPARLKRVILPTLFRKSDTDIFRTKLCFYPFHAIGVNTNGELNACCYVKTDSRYGNLFQEYDCWNNDSYKDIRRSFLNGKPPFDLCRTCGMYGIHGELK